MCFASEVTCSGLSIKSRRGQSAAPAMVTPRSGCCWQAQLVLWGHSPRRAMGALSTAGRTPGAPGGGGKGLCCVVLLQLCRHGRVCGCTRGGTDGGSCRWPLCRLGLPPLRTPGPALRCRLQVTCRVYGGLRPAYASIPSPTGMWALEGSLITVTSSGSAPGDRTRDRKAGPRCSVT